VANSCGHSLALLIRQYENGAHKSLILRDSLIYGRTRTAQISKKVLNPIPLPQKQYAANGVSHVLHRKIWCQEKLNL
jgi:hypothetical protein